MANVSCDVIWAATRNNNKFIVKRNFLQLTKEPGNLKSTNNFKYSGVCNTNTIDISPAGGEDELLIAVTKGKGEKKVLKGDFVNMSHKLTKELEGYRPDLKAAALSKLAYLHKSLRMAKAGVKKKAAKK